MFSSSTVSENAIATYTYPFSMCDPVPSAMSMTPIRRRKLSARIFMLVFARKVGDFVDRHPSIKILALAFLILIGVMLVAEGLGEHISKGYIYSAMAFSLVVEMLNMRLRKKRAKVARA